RRGTIKIRLVRARIDHVKEVSFFNDRARLKMNLGNVSRHARPNLDRLNRIKPPGEFVPFVYLFLDDSNDVNRQSRLLRYGCFLAATSRQGDEQKSGTRKKELLHLIKFAFIRVDRASRPRLNEEAVVIASCVQRVLIGSDSSRSATLSRKLNSFLM